MRAPDLLPWRDFVIETRWPSGVAALELRKRIEKSRRFIPSDESFIGSAITDTEFDFAHATADHNPFVPLVRASVEASRRNGARVRVRIRFHVVAVAFETVLIMT